MKRLYVDPSDGTFDDGLWANPYHSEAEAAAFPVLDDEQLWERYELSFRLWREVCNEIRKALKYGVPLTPDEQEIRAEAIRQQAMWDAERVADSERE